MGFKITVGITDCKKYENYYNWTKASDPTINIIKLSYKLNNLEELHHCNGVIMTGGEDVHPDLYNKHEYLSLLNPDDIDIKRDNFEKDILLLALQMGISILGICRGLQLTNVVLGGTLIYDIPTVKGSNAHGKIEGKDQFHTAAFEEYSLIRSITDRAAGVINSAHHQSVDNVGEGLVVTGIAESNVVEAVEWKEPENKSWLLLVQWHPERIADDENFSQSIRKHFIESMRI